MLEKFKKAASYIQGRTDLQPTVGIILGTGLGGLVNEIEIVHKIKEKNLFEVDIGYGHFCVSIKFQKIRTVFCMRPFLKYSFHLSMLSVLDICFIYYDSMYLFCAHDKVLFAKDTSFFLFHSIFKHS